MRRLDGRVAWDTVRELAFVAGLVLLVVAIAALGGLL